MRLILPEPQNSRTPPFHRDTDELRATPLPFPTASRRRRPQPRSPARFRCDPSKAPTAAFPDGCEAPLPTAELGQAPGFRSPCLRVRPGDPQDLLLRRPQVARVQEPPRPGIHRFRRKKCLGPVPRRTLDRFRRLDWRGRLLGRPRSVGDPQGGQHAKSAKHDRPDRTHLGPIGLLSLRRSSSRGDVGGMSGSIMASSECPFGTTSLTLEERENDRSEGPQSTPASRWNSAVLS